MGFFPSAASELNTQQPSPLEQYGKVMQLKSLMQGQQLQQQQLQSGALELQQKQLELQDRQGVNQALKDTYGASTPQQSPASQPPQPTPLPNAVPGQGTIQ